MPKRSPKTRDHLVRGRSGVKTEVLSVWRRLWNTRSTRWRVSAVLGKSVLCADSIPLPAAIQRDKIYIECNFSSCLLSQPWKLILLALDLNIFLFSLWESPPKLVVRLGCRKKMKPPAKHLLPVASRSYSLCGKDPVTGPRERRTPVTHPIFGELDRMVLGQPIGGETCQG